MQRELSITSEPPAVPPRRDTLAALWKERGAVDLTAMGIFAVIANEFANGNKVPIELVQELLESFDDSHPHGPVGKYAVTLARKLHAPPRSVLA
jgi:hypothetical protein